LGRYGIAALLLVRVGVGVMDWRKHISTLLPDMEFNPPARPEEIRDIETKLNVAVPEALREVWGQSNGLYHNGACFVWSTDDIVKENQEMRTFPGLNELYMPFDTLLFFGDDGGGDLFFFPILDGKIRNEFMFRWNHETDSRILEAHHLKTFVDKFIAAILEARSEA
jgi:hypothetical protein